MAEDNVNAIKIERIIGAEASRIFSAFRRPELLAIWWGPKGFSNTFEIFEFTPGGRWLYVMHGPDGRDYPNESVFREVERDKRIVIEHIVKPLYTMTITFSPEGDRTLVSLNQLFANEIFAVKMRDFLLNAGNENLDKLESVLAAENSG